MQMTYRHGEIYSWTRLPAAAASKFPRRLLCIPSSPQNCRNELTRPCETCALPPPSPLQLDRGPILMMERISGPRDFRERTL